MGVGQRLHRLRPLPRREQRLPRITEGVGQLQRPRAGGEPCDGTAQQVAVARHQTSRLRGQADGGGHLRIASGVLLGLRGDVVGQFAVSSALRDPDRLGHPGT
ncbi:hypothetical protein [Streptomyces canus]|uniref:hypothetical protein n=1 Tax=Streptomyces canus TaxID=58343 RepID=UPI00278B4594|nr:hypothetical protein [Streptomyces canus]MDQ0767057.1 hypothetical protein [Streptomyces canus]MDQ1065094.1 hypothetical protein [Streptomyces canus]